MRYIVFIIKEDTIISRVSARQEKRNRSVKLLLRLQHISYFIHQRSSR